MTRPRWHLAAGAVLAVAAVSAAAWHLRPTPVAPALQAAAAPMATVPFPAPGAKAGKLVVPLAHTDEQAALRELASLWGQSLPAGDACQLGMKLNLRCHQGKGGLYELRLLDRPAMLTLRDGARVSYAVLSAMDDTSVTLRLNGKSQTLGVAALAARFDGAFTTFWQMPRVYRDQVARGEQGPDVDWIAARLAQLNRVAAPSPGQALDTATFEQLRRFQMQQNLKADGVAGPRTYMRLNQLSGVAEPRLLAARTEKK